MLGRPFASPLHGQVRLGVGGGVGCGARAAVIRDALFYDHAAPRWSSNLVTRGPFLDRCFGNALHGTGVGTPVHLTRPVDSLDPLVYRLTPRPRPEAMARTPRSSNGISRREEPRIPHRVREIADTCRCCHIRQPHETPNEWIVSLWHYVSLLFWGH